MKKTDKKLSMEEMIKKLDNAKKANPLDLSSDQDLSIALMNLVSLEEHFFFSGAKTKKTGFYDLINTVRNMRKELMEKIVKKSGAENGEVWCISKHLLSASMRLLEVGTKQLGMGRKEEAYQLFNQSYDLYCLFWGLNMNLIETKDVKWIEDDVKQVKALSEKMEKVEVTEKTTSTDIPEPEPAAGFFGKMKSVIRKAVDCCIE